MSDIGRETTLDTVFSGSLTCLQYREGYRFNQDSVLLANFAQPVPGERVLDLGTGCGIIGLILAHRCPSISLVGLEIQHDLAVLAERNSRDNGFETRFEIIEGDLNNEKLFAADLFDRVVCNPPYMDPDNSRRPVIEEVALARQGVHATPQELAEAAGRVLREGGKIDVIYPAERLGILLSALDRSGLVPVRQRSVFNHPHASEMLVMVEAEKNGDRKVEILPPLYLHRKKGGEYSPEMKTYYEP